MCPSKNKQENLHVAGQTEICELRKFHNTPNERTALKRALAPLTQVTKINIVHGADDKYYLFAELNLGNPSPSVLKQLVPLVVHRVGQKAVIALEQVHISRVK